MAISTIPSAGITNGGINFRNLIINGDMSIAQRGTSKTGVGGVSNRAYPTVDRFTTSGNIPGAYTVTQDTDVPTGQGFSKSLKFVCTTADATTGLKALFIQHILEGQNLQHLKKGTSNAESITISFWVKSNLTGDFTIELDDRDNTRHITALATINSANTWEKKTITFAGDTTGALDNDNGDSLRLNIIPDARSDFTSGTQATTWQSRVDANRMVGQTLSLASSTSNYLNLTGVQLEIGTSASDFEFLPYDVNLQRCLRYYEKNAGYTGFFASNSAHLRTTMKVSKRTQNPSVAYSNSPMTVLIYGGAAEGANSGSSGTDQRSIDFVSDSHHIRLLNMTGTGASNGNGCILTDQQYVVIDAEL